MLDFRAPSYQRIDLDDFTVRTNNLDVLEKHDLVGQGILHFVNAISDLVEDKKAELSEEDWNVLSFTLKRLMIDYERGELYYYLVHTHGAEAITYNAWVHFSMDTVWTVCVRTFTDMPTSILEEYCMRHWSSRSNTVGKEGMQHVLDAIQARTDLYGEPGGLPPHMIRGLLFNEDLVDSY